ncbi:hypothetical protein DFH06DRAFT_1320588 [Mycena polygramma]|nr:hypothetical protein DFH06DRAFT_1320588 [Mycena polygramma]
MSSSSLTPSTSSALSESATSSSSSSSFGSSARVSGPTFTFTPSPSGNPPQCGDPQGCGSPPPATLYLYTFLSTLIILMLVSAGIIARSVVLRRRQRLAIANGTWVSPRPRENYAARPRPVMFDAYLAAAADGKKEDEERWSAMKPFSASDVAPPRKTPVLPPMESPQAPHEPIRRAARDQMRSVVRLYSPFRSLQLPPPAPPPPPMIELAPSSSSSTSAPPRSSPSPTQLRVALLVAMPFEPSTPKQKEDDADADDEDLPYLEFGVLEADVVDVGRTSGGEEGVSAGADLDTKS